MAVSGVDRLVRCPQLAGGPPSNRSKLGCDVVVDVREMCVQGQELGCNLVVDIREMRVQGRELARNLVVDSREMRVDGVGGRLDIR